MPVHFKKFRLSEWNGAIAALFISFGLAGCSVDVAAIVSTCYGVAATNVGTVVGYVATGGGLFMAASQVSPARQRFAPAIALTTGAFFVGNLSPQIFPAVFAGDGPLFHDLPDILVVALLCVAGFFAVLNKAVTFRKSANFFEGAPVRPRNSRLDRNIGERSAGVTKPQAAAVDLFGFSQDALVVTDAEGVVLEIDRGAETMFGWSRKHLVGQSVEVLIPHCEFACTPGPNDSSVHYSAPRILATERQKLRGVRKNGTTFTVEVSLSPGRSGGAHAIVASIRTLIEPVQTGSTSGALQPREFNHDRTVEITEHNKVDQQRHVLYATLEQRLAGLVNNSLQSVNVSRIDPPIRNLSSEANLPFAFSESPFNYFSNEVADDQWATRWADEEKNARAAAFLLLCVIDDLKKLPEIDGSRLELADIPSGAKKRVESLCDRLFPISGLTTN